MIEQFCTLPSPHRKCSHHLPPYNLITTLLTLCPVLYCSSLWLTYCVTGSLYLWIPVTYLAHLPTPSPLTTASLYLWVCLCVRSFIFLVAHVSEIMWCLSLSDFLCIRANCCFIAVFIICNYPVWLFVDCLSPAKNLSSVRAGASPDLFLLLLQCGGQ